MSDFVRHFFFVTFAIQIAKKRIKYKFMKKVSLIFICWIMSLVLFAQRVSIEDAQRFAESFFSTKATRGISDDVELAYIAESQDNVGLADFYVFNNKTGGFVIVAADERISDMLIGHSEDGFFDYENIPSNMKWWLDEYVRQIDYLRANVKPKRMHSKSLKATATEIKIAPLLGNTKWGQGEPYNRFTPKRGSDNAPTGCVATAMAQIMYYHKWPKVGMGSHTNKNDNTLTVDFSESVYQWDKMLDTYTNGNYTTEQAEAVAKLMLDCGVSVDMNYGSSGSGAYDADVEVALKTYFDFSEDVTILDRSEFNGDWDGLIISELESFRPVYYRGSDKNDGGHAFVCDGYETEDGEILLHINWGWNGSDNGYFKSTVLDAYSGVAFKLDQTIIYRIYANNKIKSGSLYYTPLLEGNAQVASPDKRDEYAGSIVIPSTITVDGKTYTVTGINSSAFSGCDKITSLDIPSTVTYFGGNVFSGCSGLQTLTLHWTENLPEMTLLMFDDTMWSNVSVIVPDGYVGKYTNAIPWSFFCNVKDSKGNKYERSKWEKFESGLGIYEYNIFYNGTDSAMSIISSHKLDDPNNYTLLIKNWVYEMPLYFTYEKNTGRCFVPYQFVESDTYETYIDGELTDVTEPFYVSDVPTYDNSCSYEDYPCEYNPETGLFVLNLAYYTPTVKWASGKETFQMEGDYKKMKVSIDDLGSFVENTDMTATQKITLSGENDVAKFKYALLDGILSTSEIWKMAKCIADGTVESKSKSNGFVNVVSVSYPQPGKYTFITIGVDAEGKYQGTFASTPITYTYSKQWKAITKGHYKETILSSVFNNVEETKYDVEMEQNIANPKLIRMKNAYGENWPGNADGSLTISKKDSYIELNISDPDAVFIPMNQDLNVDLGYGGMFVTSIAAYYIEEGDYSAEEIKEKGLFGKFEEGIITFPNIQVGNGNVYGSLLLHMPDYSVDDWYYAGKGFELDLREWYWTSVEDVKASPEKPENVGVYDLSGRKVAESLSSSGSQLSSGIYIVNGKKVLKK